ncbi:MAG: hypothetical protein Q9174_004960 [Haloplaca sp. 1 TL-2023]
MSSHTLSPANKPCHLDIDSNYANSFIGSERQSSRRGSDPVSAILMRRLPRSTSSKELQTMFLCAQDFVDARFVPNESQEDTGFLSAIARFSTVNGAQAARAMLNGKQKAANEAAMIVEVLPRSPGGDLGARRNTSDIYNRAATGSASSTGSSNGQLNGQPSSRQATLPRFNSYQTQGTISPPNGNGHVSSAGLPSLDMTSPLHSTFSPTTRMGGQQLGDRQRISGKAIIDQEGMGGEPGDFFTDSMGYGQDDLPGSLSRRTTNSQVPTSRFGTLSLHTSTAPAPTMQSYVPPRSNAPLHSPTGAMSPTSMGNIGPNGSYQFPNPRFQSQNLPPVNPADQNPPCNTLYVGNLPMDTSEDELKAIFSKQRGYKRLCFRTKQNGPMCFVEFEDISFATKALHELYGHLLHNSVRGGVRLSFSKNPLGVRTGQPGPMGPTTPQSPHGPMMSFNGIGSVSTFSTANGPPPGLAAPPGLNTPNTISSGASVKGVNGMNSNINHRFVHDGFNTNGLGINGFNTAGMRSTPTSAAGGPWSTRTGYFSDYVAPG